MCVIDFLILLFIRNFVFEKTQKRCPKLVRMLYANISYKDGIINSKVKKHPITMYLEDFPQEFNLPWMGEYYDQLDLEGNEFNFEIHAHSLLIDPASRFPTPFNVGLICPNVRSIHYTMNLVLSPRKCNYSILQIRCPYWNYVLRRNLCLTQCVWQVKCVLDKIKA